MKSNNKGITLIALVVTIVILLILAGVTISGTIDGIDSSKENALLSQLDMVQHAIIERYTKYKLTKDDDLLVGTVVDVSELSIDGVQWKLTSQEIEDNIEKQYYKIEKNDFNKIGLSSQESPIKDAYIINYYTGEVFNYTQQKTPNNKLLYKTIK